MKAASFSPGTPDPGSMGSPCQYHSRRPIQSMNNSLLRRAVSRTTPSSASRPCSGSACAEGCGWAARAEGETLGVPERAHGAKRVMDQNFSALFAGHHQLFICQEKEWIEILVDWEVKNQYTILDAQRHKIGVIAEKAGGVGDFLKRGFLRSHRPFELAVFDPVGTAILRLTRRFFFFFSELDVLYGLFMRVVQWRGRWPQADKRSR